MPISSCHTCGGEVSWSWEEAFYKFGFMDGDGLVETRAVEDVLVNAGYAVSVEEWGLHNLVIVSIKQGEKELILHEQIKFGYDDPRDYLPATIIELLDHELPE